MSVVALVRAGVVFAILLLFGLVIVLSYAGRVDNVKSDREQCRNANAVYTVQADAAEDIAHDPFQSRRTRRARAREARGLREAVRSCDRSYPYPSVLPTAGL